MNNDFACHIWISWSFITYRICIAFRDPVIKRGGIRIPSIGLTPPHLLAVPSHDLDFQSWWLFVLFLWTIVMPVLLWFSASDYTFDIFKLFWNYWKLKKNLILQFLMRNFLYIFSFPPKILMIKKRRVMLCVKTISWPQGETQNPNQLNGWSPKRIKHNSFRYFVKVVMYFVTL